MGMHPNFEAVSAATGRLHLWDFWEKWMSRSLSEDLIDRTEGIHYDLTRPRQYIVEGGVVTVNADTTKIDVSALRARSNDKSIVHAGTTALALANYGFGADNYVVARWLLGTTKERTNPQTSEIFDSMRYDDAQILVVSPAPAAGDVILANCLMRGAAANQYSILIEERSEDYSGVTGGAPDVGEQNLLPNSDLICTEGTMSATVQYPDYWAVHLVAPTQCIPVAATLDEPPGLELQLMDQEGILHNLVDEARQDILVAGSCTFLFGIKAHGASGNDIISFEIVSALTGLPLATLDLDVQTYANLTWFALSATYDPALAGNYVYPRIWNNHGSASDGRFYFYRPTLVRGIKKPKQSRYAYSTAQMLGFTKGLYPASNGAFPHQGMDEWPVPFRCYVRRIVVYAAGLAPAGHNEDYAVTRNGMPTALTVRLADATNWAQGFNRSLTIFEPGTDRIGVTAIIPGAGIPASNVVISVELQPLVN